MSVDGLIGYYGLSDWWLSQLTAAEQDRLDCLYSPFGDPRQHLLTRGHHNLVVGSTATATGLLAALVGCLGSSPDDRVLHRKVRDKLMELITQETNFIARHFSLQALIRDFYRERNNDSEARPAAICACRDQIAISPAVAAAMRREYPGPLPRHVGYEQLAIILEKDKAFTDAIAVCQEAAAAGWAGEWSKRIDRCRRRAARAAPAA